MTKLERLKEIAAMLPSGQREQLLDAEEPGELYRWCEQMRAELEVVQNLNSAQVTDEQQVKKGTGQVVRYPPQADTDEEPIEDSEARAATAARGNALRSV